MLDIGAWLRICGWLAFGALCAWWSRRSVRSKRASWFACALAVLLGLAYLACGALLVWSLRYTLVFDDPAQDLRLRLMLFAIALIAIVIGASSMQSGARLLRLCRKP